MSAGISRFVLLSAALHLGVLAGLGYGAVRPQLLPAALTVTLDEVSDATASLPRPSGVKTPSPPSDARTPSKDGMHSGSAQGMTQETPQNPSPSLLETAPQDSDANDETGPVSLRTIHIFTANAPSPPGTAVSLEGRGWPEGPGKREGSNNIAEQTTTPPAQQIDAATLASQLEDQLHNALAPYFLIP